MVDDVISKGTSPECGKSLTHVGPSPCDLSHGYQEPIGMTVYKRRFMGVAHLALLNIVVSWGVSRYLQAMVEQRI